MRLNNYATSYKMADYKIISKNIINIVNQIVGEYFSDKSMFSSDNIKIYFYDEHVLNTSVNNENYLNVYVEINQPQNVKKQFNSEIKSNKVADLHLKLVTIKHGLHKLFVKNFGANTLIGLTRYSVLLNTCEEDSNGKTTKYNIKITPCFSYENANKCKGIVYYSDNEKVVEIEYPKLAIRNFNKKNNATNGLYKSYVICFKNLIKEKKNLNFIVFEPLETLLYNVPNNLYNNLSKNNAITILNFLRNFSLKDFITIDEQDKAFTSKFKSLSALHANCLIKTLEKIIKKF